MLVHRFLPQQQEQRHANKVLRQQAELLYGTKPTAAGLYLYALTEKVHEQLVETNWYHTQQDVAATAKPDWHGTIEERAAASREHHSREKEAEIQYWAAKPHYLFGLMNTHGNMKIIEMYARTLRK